MPVHKGKISGVEAFIQDGVQNFAFTVNGLENPIVLASKDVESLVGIRMIDVEALQGLTMEVTFHRALDDAVDHTALADVARHGMRPTGDVTAEDVAIGANEDVKREVEKFDSESKYMQVKKVFTFERNGRTQAGIKAKRLAPALTERGEATVFVRAETLTDSTGGYESDFDLLAGSYIKPVYYQQGEPLPWGGACRKGRTLVKCLNLRLTGNLEKMREERRKRKEARSKPKRGFGSQSTSRNSGNSWSDALPPDEAELAYWNTN